MVVGVIRVELYIHGSNSLKSKRKEIRSIKDRLRNTFNVSVSEIDNQDKWQRGSIGIVTVGNSYPFVQESVDKVCNFLEKHWSDLIMETSQEIFEV